MSSTATLDPRHPIAAAVARLHNDLDQVAQAPVWSMDPDQTRATLLALTRCAARVAELELRVAAHADRIQVGEATGATTTANWWAHESRQTRAEAHRKIRLAIALDAAHEQVREALATGDVLVDQARVILDALEALSADLDPEVLHLAETALVGYAGEHDAKALRVLGRRILEVAAPDLAEAHEAQVLAHEETQADDATRLTMSEDGHGRVHGRFTISAVHGQMLRKALLAIAAPKHQAAVHGPLGERRPGPERMGSAFAQYGGRYPTDQLPDSGGVAATVVVTMTLDSLTGGLRAAQLDTGSVISAGQARRLACEAGIIPAVLGGPSQILDLGRRTRFHTKAQRVALGIRDRGCTTEGCDWPPGMCHAHHDTPWSQGGPTNLDNARLLCPRHHARAHDPAYTMAKLTSGKVAFHRRT